MFLKYIRIASAFLFTFTTFLNAKQDSDKTTENSNLMQHEIKHVVVLMMENRSFDNVIAWLYKQNDPNIKFIPQNTEPHFKGLFEDTLHQYVNVLKDSYGNTVFTCIPIKGTPSVKNSKYLNSPKTNPHEIFPNVINQMYGFDQSPEPKMNGFLQDYASLWWENEWEYEKDNICAVMETYTENEFPILYGLAKHYAISDYWFSSVPTQTDPNRAFMTCGTSEGEVLNGPFGHSVFQSDTIWNRLTEESPETTWKIFWQIDLLPGLISGPFSSARTFPRLNRISDLESHYAKLDIFHQLARDGRLPDFSLIEPQWTLQLHFSIKHKPINIGQLEASVKAMIIGLQGNDLHPPGDVRTAENLLANVYTSLISNPERWNETLLVITFDEHGGLYDHVPPPASISPDEHFENGFRFDTFGVRVPTIFISPRINKNTIIRSNDPNIPFDHTSFISTILKWQGIDKSRWNMGNRVNNAPTFDSVITETQPRTDFIIAPDSLSLPSKNNKDVVHMGDLFYLRNKNGEYILKIESKYSLSARLGSEKNRALMSFGNGEGELMHGSFVLIKNIDSDLGEENFLEGLGSSGECYYCENKHEASQWWTIKSLKHPYLGAPIHYGDRIYIENHIHFNLFHSIPGRLAERDTIFGEYLVLESIIEEGSEDNYWTIVKP
jgi:phospholipase C